MAKKMYIFCLLFATRLPEVKAQLLQQPVHYTSPFAYSLLHRDVFAIQSNQASLAGQEHIATAIYSERRFGLNELSAYRGLVALPTSSGNFGLAMGYAGSSEFNTTKIGLAYARKLGSLISIGAQFNYNGLAVKGYGNDGAVSFETGAILHLTTKLHTGIHLNNPVGGKFGRNGLEKLPAIFSMGFGYDISDNVFLGAELIKEEDNPAYLNTTLHYQLIEKLHVRVGITTATHSFYMGIGIRYQQLRLDVTGSFHPQLGITPGLLFVVDFKKGD